MQKVGQKKILTGIGRGSLSPSRGTKDMRGEPSAKKVALFWRSAGYGTDNCRRCFSSISAKERTISTPENARITPSLTHEGFTVHRSVFCRCATPTDKIHINNILVKLSGLVWWFDFELVSCSPLYVRDVRSIDVSRARRSKVSRMCAVRLTDLHYVCAHGMS